MTERAHRDIQPLRDDVFDVIAYLREANIFRVLNHLFHFYKGQMPMARYLELLDEVPALETRNGAMLAAHNRLIEAIIEARAASGGTGAHASRRRRRQRRPHATPRRPHAGHRCRDDARRVPGKPRRGSWRRGRRRGRHLRARGRHLRRDRAILAQPRRLAARRDQPAAARVGLGFSVVSAPFEFIPLLIAAIQKRGEARRVREFEGRARLAVSIRVRAPPPAKR